jgi:lysophospholipase L1-like esterase
MATGFDDTPPPLRLAIVGDSTVSAYAPTSPVHGWGEFIQSRMRPRVQVRNVAVPGASSSSFLAEERWKDVLSEQPGVVLIQFGHNEFFNHISPKEYAANLQQFIDSSRACGAIPIIITPVQLRVFRDNVLVPSLQPYAETARQVAARARVAVVDLNDLSGQLFSRLGPTKTEQLGSPGGDQTHFNRLGAQALAEIVLHELTHQRTPLSREIIATAPAAQAKSVPKRKK